MFLTAELIFTIFMLAAEKHKGTFLAPVGIGLALFIAELSGVYFTGGELDDQVPSFEPLLTSQLKGSLNPARSFGPAVVLGSFPGYHWIYWLGPAFGALVAVGFYRLVKTLEYETANPGQDFDDREAENFQFDEENARGADVVRPVASGMSEYRTDSQGGIRPVSSGGSQMPASSSGPGQIPGSGGRVDGGRVDGPANSTLDPKMHPGYPDNLQLPYHNGPNAEAGNLGGSYRR